MAYDDGYYYGLAKIVALAEEAGDDGKTVTVTNGTKSWTGTMADGKCTFTVPGKDRYTIRMGTYSTEVDISYGECIGVHMADGYGLAYQKDIEELQSNFQDGVDSIYDAVVSKGSTPTSKSLADVVEGIDNINTLASKASWTMQLNLTAKAGRQRSDQWTPGPDVTNVVTIKCVNGVMTVSGGRSDSSMNIGTEDYAVAIATVGLKSFKDN